MLHSKAFFNALTSRGVDFFAGVPDSLLKNFCAYVMDYAGHHVITANEGAAVGLAAGYHLATGKIGLVYMQNSGQGNAVNPLTSLVDPEVYSIPVLLLIGWRGEPGATDEPQHVKQGKITLELLETLGIPYAVLPSSIEEADAVIEKAVARMKTSNAPYALVAQKGIFEPYTLQKKERTDFELSREGAIKLVVDTLGVEDVVVSTTGKTSRELFEYRESLGQDHSHDFLTVGSMGHSSQIALGIAIATDRDVYCFDGDGAVIMHMGTLAVIGQQKLSNFKHILINNGAHDSVGGQPTAGFSVDFPAIAKACGYAAVFSAQTSADIKARMADLKGVDGPALLEIKVNKGARKDLGRPTTTPVENKKAFMRFLESIK